MRDAGPPVAGHALLLEGEAPDAAEALGDVVEAGGGLTDAQEPPATQGRPGEDSPTGEQQQNHGEANHCGPRVGRAVWLGCWDATGDVGAEAMIAWRKRRIR